VSGRDGRRREGDRAHPKTIARDLGSLRNVWWSILSPQGVNEVLKLTKWRKGSAPEDVLARVEVVGELLVPLERRDVVCRRSARQHTSRIDQRARDTHACAP